MNVKKKTVENIDIRIFYILLSFSFLFTLLILANVKAVPVGPDNIGLVANETKSAASAQVINISGGYIATINLTATVQNPRWKAFVGNVTGSFTLDDAGGSTIYDWSLTTISGEIYATRNASTIAWTSIKCANFTTLNVESAAMSHSGASDNITLTFGNGVNGTHDEFFVGAVNISRNSCPTLNTYVSNSSQDTVFEEIVLTDTVNLTNGGTVIYSTIMEVDTTGFDDQEYDFQMIVPEIGSVGFSGATAYYLYVELS